MGLGASASWAYPSWPYSYGDYVNTSSDVDSQSTSDAIRWWPAPGYSTSSNYYAIADSLAGMFHWRIDQAASDWSGVDTLFHFYELDWNQVESQYDHTFGQKPLIPIAETTRFFKRDASGRPTFDYWYIRFNSNLTFGDASPTNNVYDMKGVALHEMGHTIRLKDVDYAVPANDSSKWPTMHAYYGSGETWIRTLSAYDITAVGGLY
ncbi:MAG: hypothetical protein Kow00122_03160 [Thermoleophilia bacterium]